MTSWYEKTKSPMLVLSAITLIFLFCGRNYNFGNNQNYNYHVFTIEFQFFEMDSSQLEKLITIPLEEKFNEIPFMTEMKSVTENGNVRITTFFYKSANSKKIYLIIRNIVDELYKKLPSSAQKPRIYFSDSDSRPIFCFTVSSSKNLSVLRQFADSSLKAKFENIDGVSEVIISGGRTKEIEIKPDFEKIIEKNLNPNVFAQIVQDGNVIYQGTSLTDEKKCRNILFNTKILNINQIEKLPLKLDDSYVKLGDFSEIKFTDSKQREIVRINGNEVIAIQIKPSSQSNIIKTTSECRKILKNCGIPEANYQILSDEGENQKEVLRQISIALLQSFILILIIIPVFYSSKSSIIFILISIPLTTLWTLCQLSILHININPDCIAGLSISIGLVSDPMLVIAEQEEIAVSKKQFIFRVESIETAIIFSTLTSILALIPLYNSEYIIPGIQSIIITIGLMLCNSLIISTVFFPCYVHCSSVNKRQPCHIKNIALKFKRQAIKIKLPAESEKIICFFYIFFIIISVFILLISEKDISQISHGKILFASVEYPPEKNPASIDLQLREFINEIQKIKGIDFIRSECNLGRAEIEMGFSKKEIICPDIVSQIKKHSPLLQDGKLFIQSAWQNDEDTRKKSKKIQNLEISISGEDFHECKKIAKNAVALISKDSNTEQAFLNFKESPEEIVFLPDREISLKNSLQIKDIAQFLHLALSEPVIDKWIKNGCEYDIKLNCKEENCSLQNIYLPTQNGGIKAANLGKILRHKSDGKIYRLNGQRCAFFTIERKEKSSTQAVKNIRKLLNSIELPAGYFFRFSKEINLMQAHYNYLIFLCFFAIFLIFIALTAFTENLKISLIMISIIPISASLPLIIKFLSKSPLHTGDITGIAITGGIAINNAIYIYNCKKTSSIWNKSICASSITTVAGSIPLCLTKVQGFPKDIAFFMFWGTISSIIASFSILPKFFNRIEKSKS